MSKTSRARYLAALAFRWIREELFHHMKQISVAHPNNEQGRSRRKQHCHGRTNESGLQPSSDRVAKHVQRRETISPQYNFPPLSAIGRPHVIPETAWAVTISGTDTAMLTTPSSPPLVTTPAARSVGSRFLLRQILSAFLAEPSINAAKKEGSARTPIYPAAV
jgi:hypothetical protein